MNRLLKILIIPFLTLFLCGGTAMGITLDGTMDAAEWGTHYTDGEETFGSGIDEVGPGYGGQNFDVEKIGLQIVGNQVTFGLQTGFDFINGVTVGATTYTAGDIFIDFGSDDRWDVALSIDFDGSSNLFTLSTVSAYSDPTYSSSTPFLLTSGTELNDSVDGYYAAGTNGHGEDIYSLEGMFDLSAYSELSEFIGMGGTIHWTMSCGNDVLKHTTAPVPEPATMLLLGTGLIGLAGIGRKRFKK